MPGNLTEELIAIATAAVRRTGGHTCIELDGPPICEACSDHDQEVLDREREGPRYAWSPDGR